MTPREMQMGFSGSRRCETFSYLLYFIHSFGYFNFSPLLALRAVHGRKEPSPVPPWGRGCFPSGGMDESQWKIHCPLGRGVGWRQVPLFGLPSFPGVFSF